MEKARILMKRDTCFLVRMELKMKEIVEKSENMSSKYSISYFEARLNKERDGKKIYLIIKWL